jgi:hypothetical protein
MTFRRLGLFLMALLLAANLQATSFDPVTERDLVSKASLVFQGIVTRVEYRISDVEGPNVERLPHTFVTFRIEKLYKGKSESGRTITLRFQGGPDGQGNTVFVSGIPLFDAGDRDILFVAKNGEAWCPLVGWEQGRFRIVNDEVFSDDGREVLISEKGNLQFGNLHPLPEVLKNKVGEEIFEFDVVGHEKPRANAKAQKMFAADFDSFLSSLIKQTHTVQMLSSVRPEKNVSVRDRFSVPFSAALPAPPEKALNQQ